MDLYPQFTHLLPDLREKRCHRYALDVLSTSEFLRLPVKEGREYSYDSKQNCIHACALKLWDFLSKERTGELCF